LLTRKGCLLDECALLLQLAVCGSLLCISCDMWCCVGCSHQYWTSANYHPLRPTSSLLLPVSLACTRPIGVCSGAGWSLSLKFPKGVRLVVFCICCFDASLCLTPCLQSRHRRLSAPCSHPQPHPWPPSPPPRVARVWPTAVVRSPACVHTRPASDQRRPQDPSPRRGRIRMLSLLARGRITPS
jgi:hypothetical protein